MLHRFADHWPVLLAALFGMALTLASYSAWQWDEQRKTAGHARSDAEEYSRLLQERTESYLDLNKDAAALFAASDVITPREFAIFIKTVQGRRMLPGLAYVGYLQRDGEAAYRLRHAVPFEEATRRLLGFDFAAIAGNRDAMRKAADSGETVATGKIADPSAPSAEDHVFVFTPVYAPSMPLESPAQRRSALSGYVLSVFQVEELIGGAITPGLKRRFDLEIHDGALAPGRLLYAGGRQPVALQRSAAPAPYTESIGFADKRWILRLQPRAFYTERHASRHGWLVLLCGALASALFALVTWKWLQRRRARRMQSEHAQRFHAVFEHHPSAVFALDTQWRFINANSQSLRQFELSRSKLVGTSLLKLVAGEDAARVQELLSGALSSVSVRFDSTLIGGGGKRIEVSVVLIPVVAGGQVTSVLGIADNITERRRSEWRLEESRRMLQLVIDNIPQRVFWKDAELYFLGCNKAFCEDAGLDAPDQVVGKTDRDFAWRDQAEAYRQDDLRAMQDGVAKVNYEEAQHRQDGKLRWLRTSKIPLTDAQGHTIGVLGTYEDITERKLGEQRLEHMALYDGLTGLPNRSHFLARLEQAISKAARDDTLTALMYFDIDKFKRVNDTHGHDVGDEVIAMFAARVAGAVRESDVVGRLGGDEFCMLMESLPNPEAAQKLAAKLIDAMRPAMEVGGVVLQVGTSIGIACHRPGMRADDLIRCADQAMYLAKQAGGNRFELAPDALQRAA